MAYARMHYNLATTGKATQKCGDKGSSSAPKASPPKAAPKKRK